MFCRARPEWPLWHGTWEGDESELRQVDPETGKVLEEVGPAARRRRFPGYADGGDEFFCGGGRSARVRRRAPARAQGQRGVRAIA